jgi:urease accessory protein
MAVTSASATDGDLATPGWAASIALTFARDCDRTVLVERRHRGPLRVQKALYPEGDRVCQVMLLHPPAGIVGGDRLSVQVVAGGGSHAQITTPGAAKWYRSAGAVATAQTTLRAAAGAVVEWLPQEAIVFDGARARAALMVELDADAVFIGWEIVALGRAAAGERFVAGRWQQVTEIRRDGALLWCERGVLDGGSAALHSGAVLAGATVFGTLWVTIANPVPDSLARCRGVSAAEGSTGVTALPGVVVARYLGASAATARTYFASLWRILRPVVAGRSAVPPRIWST